MRASSYIIYSKVPQSTKTLMLHGYTGALDLVDDSIAKFLQQSRLQIKGDPLTIMSPETFRRLRSRGYLTEMSYDEERAYFIRIARALHHAARATHFAPLIIPTYACNLRCFYCYQDHLHNESNELFRLERIRVIRQDMVDAAFEAIEKLRPPASQNAPVSLGLYGGEPFLAINRPIVEYIIRRAREQGYSVGAVTNASELAAYYDLLGPDGVAGMQVTLDGARRNHDCRRIYSDGRGTYEVIVNNVTEALRRGVRVTIRINVDRNNVADLPELTRRFVEYGWTTFPGFSAYVAPLYSSNVAHVKEALTQAELADYLYTIRDQLAYPLNSSQKMSQLSTFAQLLGMNGGKSVNPFHTGVCSAVYGMYIFDPYGDVYTCWDEAGNVEHRVGTYGKGNIELKPELISAWFDRSVAEIEQCSQCAYALVCGGGCAYFAAEEKGTYYASYCDHFQRNFRQTMVRTVVRVQRGEGLCEISAPAPSGPVCI